MRPVLSALITAGALAWPAVAAAQSQDLGGSLTAALASGGVLVSLAIVFAGGLLTAATPCVFPLIPITVSIFGARDTQRRLRSALLSATYVLGIAAMYSSLGLVSGLACDVFGAVMASPWVIGGVAFVFVAMALSMFGAFELTLPEPISARLSQAGGAGYGGAFAMGLVAGIVAAPCTGPVLAAILTFVCQTHDAFYGFWLLFVYALGLGLPFFVVGTFAVSLPRSGRWMESVKSVLGMALLVTALWFVKDVAPPVKALFALGRAPLALALGLAVAGLALGAAHLSFHDPSWTVRLRKLAGIALVVAGSTLGLGGALSAGDAPTLPWQRDEPAAVARARAEGRPVMIDFTADWCVACKELDKYTFSDATVQAEAQRFVVVKIDATKPTDEVDRLHEKYAVSGLPMVAFIDSSGALLEAPRVTGFLKPPEFLSEMRRVR